MNLTTKQQDFFEGLKSTYGEDYLPSFETLAQKFGFKHKNSILQYFKKFESAGLIVKRERRYKIAQSEFGAKVFTGKIRAGFASAIEDDFEGRIYLDKKFHINSPSTFIFTVSGDSMVDLGIFEGDNVIVRKCSNANSGDIVLAILDGAFTLKTLIKENGKTFLRPANKKYPDMHPETSLSIFGVVTGVIREV